MIKNLFSFFSRWWPFIPLISVILFFFLLLPLKASIVYILFWIVFFYILFLISPGASGIFLIDADQNNNGFHIFCNYIGSSKYGSHAYVEHVFIEKEKGKKYSNTILSYIHTPAESHPGYRGFRTFEKDILKNKRLKESMKILSKKTDLNLGLRRNNINEKLRVQFKTWKVDPKKFNIWKENFTLPKTLSSILPPFFLFTRVRGENKATKIWDASKEHFHVGLCMHENSFKWTFTGEEIFTHCDISPSGKTNQSNATSYIITDDKVLFLTRGGFFRETYNVYCLNREDGKLVWKKKF